jgi:acid phosphatase
MRVRIAALLALSCVLFAACDDKNPTVKSIKPAPAPSSASPTETPFAAPQDSPTQADGIDKILVMVIENKSIHQMQANAPKIWALGQQYGYATDFKALTHPSLPNYIAMAAGSTFGIQDDKEPSGHKLTGPSVFGRTIAAGGTAAIMAEGMGEPCNLGESGEYVPRHVPWTYFVNERDLCQQNVTDAKDLDIAVAAGGLPNVGMLVPDQCHNAHDCSLGQADDWVASQVEEAMTGPDWKSGRLVIVVTADEDNRKAGNQILTVVIHPSQNHHVVTKPLTIYSLHRLMAKIGKAQPQNKGKTAPDMAKAFGLPLA